MPIPHRPTREPKAATRPDPSPPRPQRSATALRIRAARPAGRAARREPSRLFQVGRQPGDVEVEPVGLGKVHQAKARSCSGCARIRIKVAASSR